MKNLGILVHIVGHARAKQSINTAGFCKFAKVGIAGDLEEIAVAKQQIIGAIDQHRYGQTRQDRRVHIMVRSSDLALDEGGGNESDRRFRIVIRPVSLVSVPFARLQSIADFLKCLFLAR